MTHSGRGGPREDVGQAGVCGAGHEDEARGPLPLDLPAQLAHFGGADGGVRQRERRVRPRHPELPVVLHQLLVAKVLRHDGVGGQRLGYLVHLST